MTAQTVAKSTIKPIIKANAKTVLIIVLTAGHGRKDMGTVNATYQGKMP